MADDKKGFAAMFEEGGATKRTRTVRSGEEVTGTIVALSAETAFVDLGAKSEGLLDRSSRRWRPPSRQLIATVGGKPEMNRPFLDKYSGER